MKIRKIVATVVDEKGREHEVTVEPCYESYEQYGAELKVLQFTASLAEAMIPFFRKRQERSNA